MLRAAVVADATAAIASATTATAVFPELVAIIGRLVPLRAAAVVPRDDRARAVVWTSRGDDHETARNEALATAMLGAIDASEGTLAWTTIPIPGRRERADGDVAAVLAVAGPAGPVDDAAAESLKAIAAKLSPLVERPAHAAYLPVRELPARAMKRASILDELTTRVFETLDYRTTLSDVAEALGARAGKGCIIQLAGDPPLRFAHPRAMEDAEVARVVESLFVTVAITGKALLDDRAATRFAAALLGFESIACVPLLARGNVIGALCVIDVDAAAVSASALEELGRRIAAAVHNGRAYESAIASLRARDEVLSAVSHDLQNPLSTILMSAARMLDGARPDATASRPQLERIHRSAARMRSLVGDLLDVAAIESGALAIRPADCWLGELVREVVDGATPAAAEAAITLVDEVALGDHRIHADAVRVVQVLHNLVGNALKFTPPGGTITLRARREGAMLAIEVADTGIGIAKSELARIFDRFWKAEPSRRLGTGLGLAICKSLVERWDGTIVADSEADAGTTVTFTVPLASEE